jgi:hypothetical protein
MKNKVMILSIALLVWTILVAGFNFTTAASAAAATVEATSSPEPGQTPVNSMGDVLVINTPTALPLQAEAYVHPSGAFTFGLPEGWTNLTEADNNASFSDGQSSAVGALFTDAGSVYSDKDMKAFMNVFLTNFIYAIGNDYQVLEQTPQPDGSIYVAVSFDSNKGPGEADFFFEQRDTVVFVLYFVSLNYNDMLPTWQAIVASYSVDPQAALAAPVANPTPAPTVAPTPTPAPDNSALAPQPGRSRLYVFNDYKDELTFTINNTENKVPVKGQVALDLDAAKYTFTVSIPGGAVNGEVEMAPNQSWGLLVDENGSVYYPQQVY